MQLNIIRNINFLDNILPNKCASLIITDPPYFEVKGKFDFIWANREDYLAYVELWAKEFKRLLVDNGTLFWWLLLNCFINFLTIRANQKTEQ